MKMQKTIFLTGIIFLICFMNFPSIFAAEEIKFSNFRAVDFMGTRLNSIQLEQQVQFTADITNTKNTAQDFAFIVTTDNLQKKVKWITGQLSPGQTLSPAISFSFNSEKSYHVDAYLTFLPQNILDKNNPSDFSPFGKPENHLSNPLKITFTIGATIPNTSSFHKQIVPVWIKNNAALWSENQIEDMDFLNGIEFLVENNVIILSHPIESKPIPSFVDTQKDPQYYIQRYTNEPAYREWFDTNYPNYTIYEAVGLSDPNQEQIPDWIRHTTKWWSSGLISDDEFLYAITFLVENNIILVDIL